MNWQIILFNWTGYIAIMLILIFIILWIVYRGFDKGIHSFKFMWHFAIIAYYKTYGGLGAIKKFKDKDGKKYKVIEIKRGN